MSDTPKREKTIEGAQDQMSLANISASLPLTLDSQPSADDSVPTLSPEAAACPMIVLEQSVSHFFEWPSVPNVEFSERTRSDLQTRKLAELKNEPEIHPGLHGYLDKMPGFLIDDVSSKVHEIRSAEKRAEYLLSFVMVYYGERLGAKGNRRYLFSDKLKKYLKRIIAYHYNKNGDFFIDIDKTTKTGKEPTERLCLDAMDIVLKHDHTAFRQILAEVGVGCLQTTEDLVVILATLNVDHYMHVEHSRIANNRELYELLHQVNWFLTRANKLAAQHGFAFAPIVGSEQDSMTWARTKCLELEHWYKKQKTYSAKQRSYILQMIGKVQKLLAVYDDPDVLAIIKTRAGFLEIGQQNGKICAKMISFDQASNLFALTEICYDSAEVVDIELDPVWDLSWLDKADPTVEALCIAAANPMWKMFFSIDLVNKMVELLFRIHAIMERYSHDADPEGWRKAQEIYHTMQMGHDFRVKASKEEKVKEILAYLALNSHHLNNSNVQHEVKVSHQELFGGMFDAFVFLKALAGVA